MSRITSEALRNAISGVTPTVSEICERIPQDKPAKHKRAYKPRKKKVITPADQDAQAAEIDRMAESDS